MVNFVNGRQSTVHRRLELGMKEVLRAFILFLTKKIRLEVHFNGLWSVDFVNGRQSTVHRRLELGMKEVLRTSILYQIKENKA